MGEKNMVARASEMEMERSWVVRGCLINVSVYISGMCIFLEYNHLWMAARQPGLSFSGPWLRLVP